MLWLDHEKQRPGASVSYKLSIAISHINRLKAAHRKNQNPRFRIDVRLSPAEMQLDVSHLSDASFYYHRGLGVTTTALLLRCYGPDTANYGP